MNVRFSPTIQTPDYYFLNVYRDYTDIPNVKESLPSNIKNLAFVGSQLSKCLDQYISEKARYKNLVNKLQNSSSSDLTKELLSSFFTNNTYTNNQEFCIASVAFNPGEDYFSDEPQEVFALTQGQIIKAEKGPGNRAWKNDNGAYYIKHTIKCGKNKDLIFYALYENLDPKSMTKKVSENVNSDTLLGKTGKEKSQNAKYVLHLEIHYIENGDANKYSTTPKYKIGYVNLYEIINTLFYNNNIYPAYYFLDAQPGATYASLYETYLSDLSLPKTKNDALDEALKVNLNSLSVEEVFGKPLNRFSYNYALRVDKKASRFKYDLGVIQYNRSVNIDFFRKLYLTFTTQLFNVSAGSFLSFPNENSPDNFGSNAFSDDRTINANLVTQPSNQKREIKIEIEDYLQNPKEFLTSLRTKYN